MKPQPIILDKSRHQIHVDKKARVLMKTSAVLGDPLLKNGRTQSSPNGVALKTANLS
jgi:hypothetical protein